MRNDRDAIEVVQEDAGTRFDLPWRRFGWRRLSGLFMLLVGFSIGVWALLSWRAHLFGMYKVAMTLWAGYKGLYLLVPSRIQIRACGDGLQWREAGWFKSPWSKVIPWSNIARFEIESPLHFAKTSGALERAGEAHLCAHGKNAESTMVVKAYSRRIVEEMAAHLQAAYREWVPQAGFDAEQPISVVDVSDIAPASRDLHERPPNCRIQVLETDGTSTFLFDRYTPIKRTMHMIAFTLVSLFFATAVGAIVAAITFGAWRVTAWGWAATATALTATLILFFWLRQFWTRVAIVASRENLMIAWSGPLMKRERSWNHDDIAAVYVGTRPPRSFSLNGAQAQNLFTVRDTKGKTLTLDETTTDDWRWAATQIRHVMNAPNDQRLPRKG